jgi:PucR C-terminal helix-turn-helix domain
MDDPVGLVPLDVTTDGADRWQDLLDSLFDDVPKIARRFVARVKKVAGYEADEYVSEQDLSDTAITCITAVVESLRSDSDRDRLTAVAEELGRRRAQQGVPAEALATAVELNFSVIWGELMAICGPRDAVLLTTHVEQTWTTIDLFAAQTTASYNRERARIAQQQLNLRQLTIARLFASVQPTAATTGRVAHELRLDASADFTLVAADQSDAQDALHKFAADPSRPLFSVYRMSGITVAFWPSNMYALDIRQLLSKTRCARVRSIHGLARVVTAAKAAANLVEVLDPTVQRTFDLDDEIAVLARKALLDQHVDLVEMLNESLLDCTDAERERIHETVVAYLATGNAQTTATQLYCHRNTVLNRLSRFAELTGIDVTIPRQAAKAVIAWSDATG